jgi:PhnB protein
VQAKNDETVVFSWIEWPDKATRDTAYAKMQDWMKNPDKADPRMNPAKNPMPFDGKRMIFGGFAPLLDLARPISGQAPAIQPYLFFRGRCEEAINYYKTTLGAEVVMLLRFKDNPAKPGPDKVPPTLDEKIMHASLRIAGSEIMMSDGMKTGPLDFQCMSLSLAVATEAEADRIYDALAKHGTIQMPIGPTFFAKRFGSIADKFGVS